MASLDKLGKYLHEVYSHYGANSIHNHGGVLVEMVERVEKRRVYFHVFHNGFRMGELNEGALMCFWIIKLHPFSHPRISAESLNAFLALVVLANTLKYVAPKLNKQVHLSQEAAASAYYAFRYRDLSKEAIMLLAESLIY
jgi:hypothetical protein